MDDPYVNGLIEVFSAWQDYASGQALLDAVTEGKPYAETTLARLRERFVASKEHTEKLDRAADRITALQARVGELEERVLDTCEHGHDFVWLPGDPVKDNRHRCPHCLAGGLEAARAEAARWKAMAEELAVDLEIIEGAETEWGHDDGHTLCRVQAIARQSLSRFNEMKNG